MLEYGVAQEGQRWSQESAILSRAAARERIDCSASENERSAVGNTERLAKTEDDGVAMGAEGAVGAGAEQSQCTILQQQDLPLTAPGGEFGQALGPSEIVCDIYGSCAMRHALNEIVIIDDGALVHPVRDKRSAARGDRIDLGAAVVRGHEDLVSRSQAPGVGRERDRGPT